MKWFTHDSDLSKTPQMQSILAESGVAGYGRAIIMLEILARQTKTGLEFRLPLAKATGIKFWAREFLTSVEDAERTFDVFEEADLILPWRDTRMISSPMLGERVDEWTKRKHERRKGKPKGKEKVTATATEQNRSAEQLTSDSVAVDKTVVDGVIEIPTGESSAGLSDSEIMGLYTTAMWEETGEALNATAGHRKAAVNFFRKYGRESAMDSWRAYLQNFPQTVTVYDSGDTKKERRKWPLQHFIDSGAAEDYANTPDEDYAAELAEARAAGRAAPAGTFD